MYVMYVCIYMYVYIYIYIYILYTHALIDCLRRKAAQTTVYAVPNFGVPSPGRPALSRALAKDGEAQHIYIYIYIYICIYTYRYIYIYVYICISLSLCIYIYIYVYDGSLFNDKHESMHRTIMLRT